MKRKRGYVPDRGDAVWITLDPQAGHEQAGRRPALVLSPAAYNGRVSLALLCPITSQVKGYPFEVAVPKAFASVASCWLIRSRVSIGARAKRLASVLSPKKLSSK